ncbi:MAG: hypothetical protein COV99_00175 [Bacteroidetes bacterium CG12_big_fil_rev_8_21_14_0_65_60_17]|nr:MAG: hypothetical protein COV99_00175 [Bacteroidetes bacterium CG12_big_fil_rev_8_21_14_0_65_60_17]
MLTDHPSYTSLSDAEKAILDAALTEFGRAGLPGARMQDIADRAGINKAMLHYYFRSKDKLYEEVLTRVVESFMTSIEAALDSEDTFSAQLRALLDAYLRAHMSRPEVVGLWVNENLNGAPVARRLLGPERGARGPRRLLCWIEDAVREGHIRPVDPLQFMITFLGSVVIYMIGMPMFSTFRPELARGGEEEIRARVDHLHTLFYHGLKP